MNPRDVKFTDRLNRIFKNLEGETRNNAGDLWDDESIGNYILEEKEKYLSQYEMLVTSRIDYIHPEFGFENRRVGMVQVKNLIVDCIESNGARYSIRIGTVKFDNFIFVGFVVGLMTWVGQVKNKVFELKDLSINYIHDSIDLNSSIENSTATEYIKNMIKPNPLMDMLDDEERDLFKGVF